MAETFEAWRERTGHAILERYGMTETNMNTSNPYEGERVAGTVGFPLPGVSARVTERIPAKRTRTVTVRPVRSLARSRPATRSARWLSTSRTSSATRYS